jgi:uncharacterized membrane protein YhaH (DUF805 family)
LTQIAVLIAFIIAIAPALEPLRDDFESGSVLTMTTILEQGDWEKVTGALLGFGVVWILVAIPFYAAQARRLHDMGQSGLWLLLNFAWFIPFASLVPLIMCMIDGQDRENRWGPDLKAGERMGWGNIPAEPPPA